MPPAGTNPLSVIDPGAGEGVTLLMRMLTTVPSASEAVTVREALKPSAVVRVPPHDATTGALPPHGFSGEAVLRGAGAPALKSALLLSVSVQPPEARKTAVVLLGAGVAPLPSKKLALP